MLSSAIETIFYFKLYIDALLNYSVEKELTQDFTSLEKYKLIFDKLFKESELVANALNVKPENVEIPSITKREYDIDSITQSIERNLINLKNFLKNNRNLNNEHVLTIDNLINIINQIHD